MVDKAEARRRVRVAVQGAMSARGWNIADLVTASGRDRSTISDFLSGERWPQSATLGTITKALGWPDTAVAEILAGADPAAAVGANTQDDGFVAAPGPHQSGGISDDEVLQVLDDMQRQLDGLRRRVEDRKPRP
jgi:transcriptional regulator with XRE-family HTH domain